MQTTPHFSFSPHSLQNLSLIVPQNLSQFLSISLKIKMSDSTNEPLYSPIINPEEIPVQYTTLKMQLYVEAPKASEAAKFFKAAFGAVELHRDVRHDKMMKKGDANPADDDKEYQMLISVQMIIDGFIFYVSDVVTDQNIEADLKGVGSASVMYLGTADVDGAVARAVTGGAVAMGGAPAAEVVGEGKVMMKDPYGNVWVIYSSPASKVSSDDDDEVQSRKIAV